MGATGIASGGDDVDDSDHGNISKWLHFITNETYISHPVTKNGPRDGQTTSKLHRSKSCQILTSVRKVEVRNVTFFGGEKLAEK